MNFEGFRQQEISPEKKKEDTAEKPEKFEILTDLGQRKLLAERVMDLVDAVKNKSIRNMVFLDKSSRPINVLFLDLWRRANLYAEIPKINFINVGKETSKKMAEILGKEMQHPDYIGDEDYQRWINNVDPQKVIEAFGGEEIERLRKEYRYLNEAPKGTTILLVEEYTNTGESLAWAKKIMGIAFPDLQFEGHSLSQQGDALFETEGRIGKQYQPPWRKFEHEKEYGAIGVVDSKKDKLTAEPTRNFTPEDRRRAIEKYIKESGGSIEIYTQDLMGYIDQLLNHDLHEEGAEKSSVAERMVKNYLKNAIIPYLTSLKEACETFLDALDKKDTTASRVALAEVIRFQKLVAKRFEESFSSQESEIVGQILGKNKDRDLKSALYTA